MQDTIPFRTQSINVTELKKNNRKLSLGVINPAQETVSNSEVFVDHTSEPIKSMDTIYEISEYLILQSRWRDNMLFIVGINFGLRVSDLRELRFCNLINDNFVFKETFPVFETKTRNTRKRKKNRYITINDAVIEAVTLYLEKMRDNGVCVSLSDYMFTSLSNNTGNGKPLTAKSIDRILKQIATDLDLGIKMSTHTLRKTFCYHQMVMSNNDNRKLLLLQKMLGHSSPAQTLDYIGITGEEIEAAYKELNLGHSKRNYLVDSEIYEFNNEVI